MKTQTEFLTRLIAADGKTIVCEKETTRIDDATLNILHDKQVTFEDMEEHRLRGGHAHTHVIEFRDGEHYNDMYFI